MRTNSSGEGDWADRWDQLYDALSAEPRREIIISLMDEPKERRLPLPDAAISPNQTKDADTLSTELRHYHLPKLADAGYVRWESNPFCVQRGPNFQESALVPQAVFESMDAIPETLVNNCKVLLEMEDNDSG